MLRLAVFVLLYALSVEVAFLAIYKKTSNVMVAHYGFMSKPETLNLTSFKLYLMTREIIIELCVYVLDIRLLTD